jgi:hypothetical protein
LYVVVVLGKLKTTVLEEATALEIDQAQQDPT